MGVAADRLDIRGMVSLPLSFGKFSPPLRLDFYVMANLALPCNGLIGLPTLRAYGISVHPESHTIKFAGRSFKALDDPRRVASSLTRAPRRSPPSAAVVPPPPVPAQEPTPAPWTVVDAIVLGRHEVPDRCAYAVPVALSAPATLCDKAREKEEEEEEEKEKKTDKS